MKSIKTPILILKILGWLSIITGIIFLILTIISPVTTYLKLAFFLSQSAPGFLGGLILLCLARGLSREEKWSWYFGIVIFSLSLISSAINIIKGQLLYFWGIIVAIILLSELIPEREIFIKQPKEKISQWFRKPCFIGTIAGIIFLCLSIGISTYLMYSWAKEARTELEKSLEKAIEEGIMREETMVENFSIKTHTHEVKFGSEYVYGYKMDRPPAGECSSSYCRGVSIYCWNWVVYTSKEEKVNPKIFIYNPSPDALTERKYNPFCSNAPDILKIKENMELVKTEKEKIQDSEYYFQKFFYVSKEGADKENMILAKWFAGSFEKSGTIAVFYKDETDKNLEIFNQMLFTFRFLE